MMTAEQLKGSILQLAMQGKLVEQRPEEGTGEDLYKTILAEKKKLVKDGSIKAGKKYNAISEEEIMFDIPETWVWSRLSDIVFNRGQKKPENAFSYIDIGSIDNVHQKLNDEENIIEAENAPSRARKIVAIGDVIYSTVRPYLHNMCIIDREFSHEPIASTGFAAMTCHEGLYNRFLFYYLLSPGFDRYANDTENSKGVAYPAINDQKLYKALVPLPPLAEQKRIVAKIEELMPFVEQYAATSTKLSTLNASFSEMMKKSILQEAVQGKLVEQRPEEGTGTELYEIIRNDKKSLMKSKIIKKEKPLPEIKEEDIPYDIPDSWVWVRIGLISNSLFAGGDKPKDFTEKPDRLRNIPVVANGVSNNGILGYTSVATAKANTITVAGRGTIGFSVFREYEYCPIVRLIVIEQNKNVFPQYLQYALQALPENSLGTSIPQLTVPMLYPKLIPLPPLAEQKRIVAKIEELMPFITELGSGVK